MPQFILQWCNQSFVQCKNSSKFHLSNVAGTDVGTGGLCRWHRFSHQTDGADLYWWFINLRISVNMTSTWRDTAVIGAQCRVDRTATSATGLASGQPDSKRTHDLEKDSFVNALLWYHEVISLISPLLHFWTECFLSAGCGHVTHSALMWETGVCVPHHRPSNCLLFYSNTLLKKMPQWVL